MKSTNAAFFSLLLICSRVWKQWYHTQCALACVLLKEKKMESLQVNAELQQVSLSLIRRHHTPGEAGQCLPFPDLNEQLLINNRYGKNFSAVAPDPLSAPKWGLPGPHPAASASPKPPAGLPSDIRAPGCTTGFCRPHTSWSPCCFQMQGHSLCWQAKKQQWRILFKTILRTIAKGPILPIFSCRYNVLCS